MTQNGSGWRGVLGVVVNAVAAELGQQIAAGLLACLEECVAAATPQSQARRATQPEVDAFLAGGAFARFVQDKVVRDACTRFAALPQAEQRVVLTSLRPYGDADTIVRQLVRYMSTR